MVINVTNARNAYSPRYSQKRGENAVSRDSNTPNNKFLRTKNTRKSPSKRTYIQGFIYIIYAGLVYSWRTEIGGEGGVGVKRVDTWQDLKEESVQSTKDILIESYICKLREISGTVRRVFPPSRPIALVFSLLNGNGSRESRARIEPWPTK